MNLEDTKTRVAYLIELKDDEAQHGEEDALRLEFIEGIANDEFDAHERVEIARELLRLSKADFARYCA